MEYKEYKDELLKEEKEEQLLVHSAKSKAQNYAKVGFLVAIIPYAFVVVKAFITNCLSSIGGKGLQILYRYGTFNNALIYIAYCVGVVGLILSVLGYKNSSKDDVASKKFSVVGMTLGSLQLWFLVSRFIYFVIDKIVTA